MSEIVASQKLCIYKACFMSLFFILILLNIHEDTFVFERRAVTWKMRMHLSKQNNQLNIILFLKFTLYTVLKISQPYLYIAQVENAFNLKMQIFITYM